MNDPLHDRLRQAADDTGQPLKTDLDDLLGRARAGRSRHRTRIAGAALVTAAAVVGTSLGVRAALPDGEPVPTAGDKLPHSAVQAEEKPLAHDEIIRRCLPQLAKYDDYPMYPDTRKLTAKDWMVSHERDYAVGDIVALNALNSGNPVLCAIPEQGSENKPVTFADLDPAADQPARIAEVCSEMFLPPSSFDPESGEVAEAPSPALTPDLRGATVAAVDDAGLIMSALLVKDGEHWTCTLTPLTSDAAITEAGGALPRSYQVAFSGTTSGPDNKSLTKENASYYTAAGVMPRDARSIEVTLATGATFSVPVNDGNYAFVLKDPGSGGLVDADYRVLDAHGNVLGQGSSM
ncbi:hypothetical protein [Nocardioides sp. Soil796]|uniref:hypothetical protein n=1 Tax=Nocardioides sp. Soil796 TaxID=1736412 RepID=UPI000709C50C|nr:hypothetical protein [Nocardioides sp. Soil796]KRF16184.1 hypothetical protein ASH02_06205 [Nocardioides sp. Soil796]